MDTREIRHSLYYGDVNQRVVQLGNAAIPALINLLCDSEWQIRRNAATVLGIIAEENEVDLDAVRKRLAVFVAEVGRIAPDALGKVKREAAKNYVLVSRGVSVFRGQHQMEGVQLESTVKPPSDKKTYRAGREVVRAFA